MNSKIMKLMVPVLAVALLTTACTGNKSTSTKTETKTETSKPADNAGSGSSDNKGAASTTAPAAPNKDAASEKPAEKK